MADDKLGVAFSGGGIRSAAFCSGVLRRLIRKKREPDFLSCVSGGGYTGSAYVQWKYHNGENSGDWTDEFFDHMRTRTAYLCNWKNLWSGCMDSFALGALIVFVAIIVLVAGWCSFAFPIAFLVNFLYGKFLDGTLCRNNDDSNDCRERTYLFSVSFGIFIVFHLLEYFNKTVLEMKVSRGLLKLGQLISGATFAFTFFPWFINDFLRHADLVIEIGIVAVTAVLWFFIPLLRKYSSLGILIYAYSYVVYWRIYKGKLFDIEYTEERFRNCMIFSLISLAVFSVFGNIPLRLGHLYYRWRLQRAFYYQDLDCSGSINKKQCCHCYDIFPGGHCPQRCCLSCRCPPTRDLGETVDASDPLAHTQRNRNQALTLADLYHIKPKYISNMVVNGWHREDKKKYCLLTMDPEGISVIDKQPTTTTAVQIDFEDGHDVGSKLKPSDIKLSSAMAMSAAAISRHLGKYKESERQFTHILTVCGIEMAGNIVFDMNGERNEHWCGRLWFFFANFIIMVAISVGGVFGVLEMLKPSFPISSLPVVVTLSLVGGILAVLLLVFCLLCLCPCSSKSCSNWKKITDTLQRCSRWCVVHLPIYHFVHSMINTITDSETPPAMLHLSDGGHFENYGLLPLLKLRLPKILVVDGSEIKSDDVYGKAIVQAMEEARELLDCSFTPMTGDRDVLTEIKNEYVNPKRGKPPRKYEFKVHYSGVDDNGVSEGHIVLIAPRRPDGGDASTYVATSVEDPKSSCNIEMSETQAESNESTSVKNRKDPEWQDERCEGRTLDENWGQGPCLTKDDVEVIEGCPGGIGCCECCHVNFCGGCFTFPRHPTTNQFFTPLMFAAYHREGYRACMECDNFLEITN